ncbi:phosphoglycerate mutase (2,3-diphosphoglycerate-independent) [Candidatus Falkowbacteria bacterium RBG_13_39_14]|uniref:2,3-bisphosphoglycerate-independent phosphoglycerate mutase n=1 Tax=Candidatus Falkowbacteria bacterium RBG_13_39_14 TaxID=1797985 RepID=A0A1F5S1A8_9BACT|nr:MAG: phosphoglycerate mutase (2,3-diphosphoglycerate-independent) [Candidatus Falkowbacteria bacterium RBG_13_39_14]
MQKNKSPLLLLILDGWGIAPPSKGNAVTLAKTPVMDKLYKKYPNTKLIAHGEKVGLPKGQDGNSEAGHMNMGAGRIVPQDTVIINKAIEDGCFFDNPAFIDAIRHAENNKSNIHLMGMVSGCQSAHSFPGHLEALLKLMRDEYKKSIYLHIFTDGRDAPPYESMNIIMRLVNELQYTGRIATICGRFYAMDRKKNWQRTEKAYDALTLGKGIEADNPLSAISRAYNSGQSDEFIEPTIIKSESKDGIIADNDSVIFFNLRSDRARQLAKLFVQNDFNKKNPNSFKRKKVLKNLKFVAMTDFGPDLDNIITAFPTKDLTNTLPIALSLIKQLYVAESEKYAHMTYFFNGGYADSVDGEVRAMIPSPDVKSYDEKPDMNIRGVVDTIRKGLDKYDFIAANFANPDMIGHTGNLEAGIKAVEIVDSAVGEVVEEVLKKQGTVIITADHGNIEEMINLKTGETDTEHSNNPVPFIIAGNSLIGKKLSAGVLGDIAPTVLKILGIKKPAEMTGKSLI